jgi:hypothetical protein
MNSTDFKAIEQFDIIKFQRDGDPEPRIAAVDKDGDNAVLVGYVHNNKGYWHTVTARDVIEVVQKFNNGTPAGQPNEAARLMIKDIMVDLERLHNAV